MNETGLQQAQRLAAALASEPLAAVYSSPLSRTIQTAEAIALGHALMVEVEDGLIEMDVGEADGLTYTEMRSRYPGLLESWVSDEGPGQAMPGGERLVDVQERGWRTVQDLAARHHSDAAICVVSHNFVILTALCTAMGIELSNFRRLRHQVAAISLLDMRPGRARVQRLNDVCHLAG